MKPKWFDPKESFFGLSIVRKTMKYAFVLFSALLATYLLLAAKTLEKSWTVDGFNYFFLTVLRVPLGVLAVTAAVLAIFATNHKSEQNRASMQLMQAQNNFANYFRHLEEFNRYVEEYRSVTSCVEVTSKRRLHNSLFQDAVNGDFSISDNFVRPIISEFAQVLMALKRAASMAEEDDKSVDDFRSDLAMSLANLHSLVYPIMSFDTSSIDKGCVEVRNPDARRVVGSDYLSFLGEARLFSHFLLYLLRFSSNYDSTRAEKVLVAYDRLVSTPSDFYFSYDRA